jgi:hypothetical protein
MRSKETVVEKSLSVEFKDGIPHFVFVGDWSGKDMILVHNHMFKEYRINQRKTRRTEPVTTKEESNERPS